MLTEDAYRLAPFIDKVPAIDMGKDLGKKFDRYMELLSDRKDDADWLEQLACTHFLKAIYPEKSRDEIVKLVHEHEKQFKQAHCEEAYDRPEKFGLIKN